MTMPESFDTGDSGSGGGLGPGDGATMGSGEDAGNGAGAQLGADQQQTDTSSPAPNTNDDSNGEIKFNPAWNGLLGKIPDQFHHVVAPDLKQWDRNYNNLAQQYAAWKSFDQQGVKPDDLQKAYQVYRTIEANPMEVYRRLGEALKDQLPQRDTPNNTNTNQQQNTNSYDDGSKNTQEPPDELTQLREQFNQLQQAVQGDFQSRQQAQLEQQYSQQIDNTLSQLEQQNGAFDKKDVLQRVAAQIQMGQEPNIVQAYQEQQAFIQQYAQQQQQQSNALVPPNVMPPNGGGTPATLQNTDTSTESGRAAKFQELINLAKNSQ